MYFSVVCVFVDVFVVFVDVFGVQWIGVSVLPHVSPCVWIVFGVSGSPQ